MADGYTPFLGKVAVETQNSFLCIDDNGLSAVKVAKEDVRIEDGKIFLRLGSKALRVYMSPLVPGLEMPGRPFEISIRVYRNLSQGGHWGNVCVETPDTILMERFDTADAAKTWLWGHLVKRPHVNPSPRALVGLVAKEDGASYFVYQINEPLYDGMTESELMSRFHSAIRKKDLLSTLTDGLVASSGRLPLRRMVLTYRTYWTACGQKFSSLEGAMNAIAAV